MIRKFLFGFLIVNFIFLIFAEDNLNCNWVPQTTCNSNDAVLYANSNVFNNAPVQPLEFMSSHTSISGNSNYDTALCCTSPLNGNVDRLSFYGSPTTDALCPVANQPLFYLTGPINGIVGLNFTPGTHNTVVCADLPSTASYANIVVHDTDFYRDRGYQCLFRISNETNGRVSSCDGRFGFGLSGQYPYAIWAKLIEADSSLRCNADCTSNLDNRVYSACTTVIPACYIVPSACDGSLYGGWVELPTSPTDAYGNHETQIHCESPWTQTRLNPEYIESIDGASIRVEAVDGTCENILSQEYSVIVDNIPYKMNVYICSN